MWQLHFIKFLSVVLFLLRFHLITLNYDCKVYFVLQLEKFFFIFESFAECDKLMKIEKSTCSGQNSIEISKSHTDSSPVLKMWAVKRSGFGSLGYRVHCKLTVRVRLVCSLHCRILSVLLHELIGRSVERKTTKLMLRRWWCLSFWNIYMSVRLKPENKIESQYFRVCICYSLHWPFCQC